MDDERHILELISYNPAEAGYEVETVETGEEALSKTAEFHPDLILLDVMLPDIDGLQVCTRLKRDPDTAGIPVIMLTARGDEIDKVLGLEMGADDYVVKPFGVRELVGVSRRCCADPVRISRKSSLPSSPQPASRWISQPTMPWPEESACSLL